jgi:ubiquinone/menaquinone biosynthesis C-methylase UbiE
VSERPVMPLGSVRGRIRAYIERHAPRLGVDVLEVGSGIGFESAWFRVNRDLAAGAWLGMDMNPGPGVDVVADLHALPPSWSGRFTGVVCSEVLEHVARPWVALPKLHSVLQRGGTAIFTTLFAFPVHGFPDDFYRYSSSGLRLLLEDAGFSNIETEYAGAVTMGLNDHGEDGITTVDVPIHIFATATA